MIKTNLVPIKNKENDLHQQAYLINNYMGIACTIKTNSCANYSAESRSTTKGLEDKKFDDSVPMLTHARPKKVFLYGS